MNLEAARIYHNIFRAGLTTIQTKLIRVENDLALIYEDGVESFAADLLPHIFTELEVITFGTLFHVIELPVSQSDIAENIAPELIRTHMRVKEFVNSNLSVDVKITSFTEYVASLIVWLRILKIHITNGDMDGAMNVIIALQAIGQKAVTK